MGDPAGAGMFYNQDTGNPRFDMARNIAGRIRVKLRICRIPTLFWNNALANISGGVANITLPYAFANKYERRTPYTMEYLLNIQRQLGMNFVVEVGYLGSISRKLEFLRAVNESLPGTVGATARAPYPKFGRIQLVDNSANGAYNSASIKLTKRFSRGFRLLSSYTYAQIDGRFERHPRPGAGYAVSAEQLLPQMRVGPVGVRYAPPFRDLGVVGSADRERPEGRCEERFLERVRRRMADRRYLDRAERIPADDNDRRHRPLGSRRAVRSSERHRHQPVSWTIRRLRAGSTPRLRSPAGGNLRQCRPEHR